MDGRQRLAAVFGAYVDSQGWTQTEVAAKGGPSTTSQTKIRMTDEPLSRQTLYKVDDVMGWTRGTAARIVAGVAEPEGHRSIRDYSDVELIREVARRIREGGTDGSTPDAGEKTGPRVDVARTFNVEPSPQPEPGPRSE